MIYGERLEGLKKDKRHAFGKDIFLLGEDNDGMRYWLEAGSFDCNWYWGFGYIETYTNNKNPENARDIITHSHFDSMFFNKTDNAFDAFKKFFVKTTLRDDEIWKLCEMMRTFYICRDYSDLIYRGGANFTSNPIYNTIKNDVEYSRINKSVIPELLKAIYDLLTPAGKRLED